MLNPSSIIAWHSIINQTATKLIMSKNQLPDEQRKYKATAEGLEKFLRSTKGLLGQILKLGQLLYMFEKATEHYYEVI